VSKSSVSIVSILVEIISSVGSQRFESTSQSLRQKKQSNPDVQGLTACFCLLQHSIAAFGDSLSTDLLESGFFRLRPRGVQSNIFAEIAQSKNICDPQISHFLNGQQEQSVGLFICQ
ncbi:MAG: hypothetical protein ACYSW8_20470, partial [Planctomycetota bacterium]